MKRRILNENGWVHWLVPFLVICMVVLVGVRIITASHTTPLNSSTPQVSTGGAKFEIINPKLDVSKKAIAQQQAQATEGIVQPNNPSQSLPPNPSLNSYSDSLNAINNARSVLESMPGMSLSLTTYEALTPAQQIFVVTNIERVDRGLSPAVAMTVQLDSYAQTAVNTGAVTDPEFIGSTLTSGAQVSAWGGNWAGGSSNALAADYNWMYNDGYIPPPGQAFNVDCTSPGAGGCWGHRDNILGAFATCSGATIYMGTAYNATAGPPYYVTYGEILVGACGAAPTDEVFTWQQALADLG